MLLTNSDLTFTSENKKKDSSDGRIIFMQLCFLCQSVGFFSSRLRGESLERFAFPRDRDPLHSASWII